ncbi:endoribonuclease L-PSP [Colletotrichum tabaci]|uniref:Protein mmf1, mitochondrial n=2 Tax=Colletotrichum destructivum species complex TaxID=2707350 RepID=A0A4U6XWK9_9PEZI|nr:Protein mmf1, mitochondrial [Colletotrichum tanaceti]TKW60219.1 Protein mmf1, mitochondrial [Colletotrichum tanaceti]
MSEIEKVLTTAAPPPLPQFSQAIKYNGMVYCSGSIGILTDRPGMVQAEGTVKDRTRQALKNLAAVLEAAGSSPRNIVKVNVYITKMTDFAIMNEAYDEFFTWDPKPARTCVAVYQLPLGTDVEIECTAFLNKPAQKL